MDQGFQVRVLSGEDSSKLVDDPSVKDLASCCGVNLGVRNGRVGLPGWWLVAGVLVDWSVCPVTSGDAPGEGAVIHQRFLGGSPCSETSREWDRR
jgi:hypothetical protein